MQALLDNDGEDGLVRSISTSLDELAYQRRDSAVRSHVDLVLRGCELSNGIVARLARQQPLTASLGELTIASTPDHLLSSTLDPNMLLHVVTHETWSPGRNGLAFEQVIGRMLAAALSNDSYACGIAPITGIRVAGTRWVFLRADFSQDYLDRLSAYALLPSDRFTVWAWGGPMPASGSSPWDASAQWGLDYTNPAERKQILRMVAALGREAQQVADKGLKGELL